MALFLTLADREVERITGKVWTGQETKDFLGRGDGENDTFWTSYHPVLSAPESSGGTVTNDPTAITVYLDDVQQGTAVYALSGQDGRITFASDYVPDAGVKVTCTYYYSLNDVRLAAAHFAAGYASRMLAGGEQKAKSFEDKAKEVLDQFVPKKLGVSYH
jgi:hypothetical protein